MFHVEEFLEEHDLQISFSEKSECFFLHPKKDEGTWLSPCCESEAELAEWIDENSDDILKILKGDEDYTAPEEEDWAHELCFEPEEF